MSNGDYLTRLLVQLPWAYRMNQLRDAVRDCYVIDGNYFDSSKYDACNDVPRYEHEVRLRCC